MFYTSTKFVTPWRWPGCVAETRKSCVQQTQKHFGTIFINLWPCSNETLWEIKPVAVWWIGEWVRKHRYFVKLNCSKCALH
jgi:hypothetical protein